MTPSALRQSEAIHFLVTTFGLRREAAEIHVLWASHAGHSDSGSGRFRVRKLARGFAVDILTASVA